MFSSHVPIGYYAGNFRQVNPSFPCLNCDVGVDGIPGSSPDCVGRDIALLFQELQRVTAGFQTAWPELAPEKRALHLAIILGYMVGRFIQIHPFLNGNGRISRLLWAWGLWRFGVPAQVRVRRHPENPTYNSIMAKAMRGDFNPLALFILSHLSQFPPKTGARDAPPAAE